MSDLPHSEQRRAHIAEAAARMDRVFAQMAKEWGHTLPTPPNRCPHSNVVPVALALTGEVVAALCPDCDKQLPAEVWQRRRALLAPPTTSELFAGTTKGTTT